MEAKLRASEVPSDICDDYTKILPKPTNKWTTTQHVTLAWLARTYQNDWKDYTSIFNKYFQNELPTSHGLSQCALSSMWYCMQHKTHGKAAWKLLSTSSSSALASSRHVNQALLEQTATDLGIQLVKKVSRPASSCPKPMKLSKVPTRKRKAIELDKDTSDENFTSTSFSSDHETMPRTPKKRRFEFISVTPKNNTTQVSGIGLLTPPSSIRTSTQQSQLTKRKRLPRIAFRAYSNASQGINSVEGFRSGKFIDGAIPLAPSPDLPQYRADAIRHVAPRHTGPTSFISATRNLMRALHRAIKTGLDSSIAVIDLHEADREGRVQSASSLRLQVDHYYRPQGEFLIFGAIEKSAIVSIVRLPEILAVMPTIFRIDVMRDAKFVRLARQSFKKDPIPMSYHAGQAVGNLMHALSIPARADLCEAAVYSVCQSHPQLLQPFHFLKFESTTDSYVEKLITDWKFEGRWRNWQTNESFRSGVEQGYRSRQSDNEKPLNFEEVAEVATNLIEEEESDYEYEVDEDNMENHRAVDILGLAGPESMRLNDDELTEFAAAVIQSGLDEESGRSRDATEDHIPEEDLSIGDGEAFARGFVAELRQFIEGPELEHDDLMVGSDGVVPTQSLEDYNRPMEGESEMANLLYAAPSHELQKQNDKESKRRLDQEYVGLWAWTGM